MDYDDCFEVAEEEWFGVYDDLNFREEVELFHWHWFWLLIGEWVKE